MGISGALGPSTCGPGVIHVTFEKRLVNEPMLTVQEIKSQARDLGFDLCGVAPATALPELTRLQDWLDRGYAGEMVYMHKSATTRADIRNFLPSARSVIVTGSLYHTNSESAQTPSSADETGPVAQIARYAWGDDYHVVLSKRLEALVDWMRQNHDEPFDAAIFVDKHHVQERVFAKHAGLGWIGKNTCIINPEIGSWVLLAGVAVSLDLPIAAPVPDQCGACTLCLDACPTGALVDEYELDATRCISYLTIELEGSIPEEQRPALGNHVYGCDICQEVCPWNLAPLSTLDPAWLPKANRDAVRADQMWLQSDFELHHMVRDSAMTRTTIARLRRNLAVVLGNSRDPRAAEVLQRPGQAIRRAAHSAGTPLVQEHVAWAHERLRHDQDRDAGS